MGICVGMQMLASWGREYQDTAGFDWIKGEVVKISPSDKELKVPHMGWNNVYQQAEHPLWQGIESGERFYFVHSYYVEPQPAYTIGTCHYGPELAAMVGRDNLFATQFHPEKSHTAGLQLLKNFTDWNGRL